MLAAPAEEAIRFTDGTAFVLLGSVNQLEKGDPSDLQRLVVSRGQGIYRLNTAMRTRGYPRRACGQRYIASP